MGGTGWVVRGGWHAGATAARMWSTEVRSAQILTSFSRCCGPFVSSLFQLYLLVRASLNLVISPKVPRSLPEKGRSGPNSIRLTLRTPLPHQVHASLASFVPPEAVHCGYQAEGFEEVWEGQQEGDGHTDGEKQPNGQHEQHDGAPGQGPSSSVVLRFRGRPPVTARLAVAADGVFSAMRAALFPSDPGPRYLGHMNWNCLLHNPGGNTVVDAHKPGGWVGKGARMYGRAQGRCFSVC